MKFHNLLDNYLECGGTILDSRTILTAANCFPYYKDENFQIYAGITEKHEPGKYGQERYVKSVTIHPKYDECEFV